MSRKGKSVKTAAGMTNHQFQEHVLDQSLKLPSPSVLPSNQVLVERIGTLLRRKEHDRVRGTGEISLWPLRFDTETNKWTDEPLELGRSLRLDDSTLFSNTGKSNYGRFYFGQPGNRTKGSFMWIEDSHLATSGALSVICPPDIFDLLTCKAVKNAKNLWPENIQDMVAKLEQYSLPPSSPSRKRARTDDDDGVTDEVIEEVCAAAQEPVSV